MPTRLPFELRSAPSLFNQFAETLQWSLQHNDYLIVGAPDSHGYIAICWEQLQCLLSVCRFLWVPVAMDKVDGPIPSFSGSRAELSLTADMPTLAELAKWQSCSKRTKGKLPSLVGKPMFAVHAVSMGRLFIRCLITLSMKVKR